MADHSDGVENPGGTVADFDPARAVQEAVALADEAREPAGRRRGRPNAAVADAGPEDGNADGLALDARPAFDEVACRAGIDGLLALAESGVKANVRRICAPVLTDKRADQFAEKAAFDPDIKAAFTGAAVEACRKYGLNIGPEATLVACVAKLGYDHVALLKELRALVDELRPPANATTA
jgi:hypothetical protein